MHKIANTAELTEALQEILRYASSHRPSRVVLAHELRELSVRVAGGKTFAEAKQALVEHLKSKGWKLSDQSMKVPHATSPDGELRLWFKAQAVYFTKGQHSLGAARTLTYDTNDLKKLSPEQFVKQIVDPRLEDDD